MRSVRAFATALPRAAAAAPPTAPGNDAIAHVKRACFLFPGQGAQTPGMGRDLAQSFPSARVVFDEVDEALGTRLSRLMFDVNTAPNALAATEVAQPAIVAHSVAAVRVLQHEIGLPAASCLVGHSLGEYSALVVGGAVSLWDAVRLVHARGRAMQAACTPGEQYAMAALQGVADGDDRNDTNSSFAVAVQRACDDALHTVPELRDRARVCAVANVNSRTQCVISGHRDAVVATIERAKTARLVRRATFLNVSAPFHCTLMRPAADTVAAALESLVVCDTAVPLISNVTGEPVHDATTLKHLLIAQVTAPVRFDACVRRAERDFAPACYLEFGPGRVLSSLVEAHGRAAAAATATAAAGSSHVPAASSSFTSTATRFSSAASTVTAVEAAAADADASTCAAPSVAALGSAEQLIAFIKSHR